MEGSDAWESREQEETYDFPGIFWGVCSSCLGKDKSGGTQQTPQVEELKLRVYEDQES